MGSKESKLSSHREVEKEVKVLEDLGKNKT